MSVENTNTPIETPVAVTAPVELVPADRDSRLDVAAKLFGTDEPAVVEPVVTKTEPVTDAEKTVAAEAKKAEDKLAADKKAADDKAAKVKTAHEKAATAAGKTVADLTDVEKQDAEKGLEPAVIPEDPYELTPELEANPQVKLLRDKAVEADQFRDLLAEGWAIPTEDQDGKPLPAEKVMAALRLERQDSHAMYDIIAGTKPVDALLGMLLNHRMDDKGNFVQDPTLNYTKDISERVFTQAMNFFAKNGYIQNYLAAAGVKMVRQDFKLPDGTVPAEADINRQSDNEQIKNLQAQINTLLTNQGQQKQNADAEVATRGQQAIFNNYAKEVERLGKEKGLDAEEITDYVTNVAKDFTGNAAVLGRIGKNMLIDVRRSFAKYHNGKLTAAQKYAQKLSADKDKVSKTLPKNPSGGSAPVSTTKARSVATRDDRLEAALAELKGTN